MHLKVKVYQEKENTFDRLFYLSKNKSVLIYYFNMNLISLAEFPMV